MPLALLAGACGHADDSATPPALPAAEQARCVPASEGRLHARLQGEIDADVDWSSASEQCRGGLRPDGDGVRLIYRGNVPGEGPLLIVIGMGPLRAGESSRNVPANLTLVREGTGRFFATQGDDKCAMDEVQQVAIPGQAHTYRLTGRGYCTQPARAVAGEGAVLVSRFDVLAIVEFK